MFKIISICKGGGYNYCRTEPTHPRANTNGLYPLHRVLIENDLGRLLDPGEVVHHRDHDKKNDDLSNLEVLSNRAHACHHRPEQPKIVCICPVCGNEFRIKAHILRIRLKRTNGVITCSRSCGAHRPESHSYRNGCRCNECRMKQAAQQRCYRASSEYRGVA